MIFPTDLSSFLDLIHQHGDSAYVLIFVSALSHSLLFGLFAGYAAHSGVLALGKLIIVCWIGSFCGDVIRFWIGRKYGVRALASFPRLSSTVATAARLADKHYLWMILVHRFVHGIRQFAAMAFGRSSLPWSTFLTLNFIAAGLWSCVVVSVGYAFGQVSEKLMKDTSSGFGVVMLVIFLGLSFYLSRKLERTIERS